MRNALHEIFDISPESWAGTNHKWQGYQHRINLEYPTDGGETIYLGLVAYGGESQRGTIHVELNGTACARIQDWQLIHDWGSTVEAAITRVDVAHDDFEGKIVNIASARKWYTEGEFSFNGRPPAAELIDDLDSGRGKTFYVGSRQNGKIVRIYEKGKKECDPESPWCRVEVEWRSKSRIIPWYILLLPGQYLAGAYPCLAYLSEHQIRIKTIQKAANTNYQAAISHVRMHAGKVINLMLRVENGDNDAVIRQIVRDGIPKRLEPYIGMPGAIRRSEDENLNP